MSSCMPQAQTNPFSKAQPQPPRLALTSSDPYASGLNSPTGGCGAGKPRIGATASYRGGTSARWGTARRATFVPVTAVAQANHAASPPSVRRRRERERMVAAAATALQWLKEKDAAELSTMRAQSTTWYLLQVWIGSVVLHGCTTWVYCTEVHGLIVLYIVRRWVLHYL